LKGSEFDPLRRAILLVAGDKSGTGEKNFYKHLIEKADSRYKRHLARLTKTDAGTSKSRGSGS
jgi:hypothetical protein